MTTLPDLEPAGLEAAHATYERYGQEGDLRTQRLSDGCMSAVIRAYLAARSTVPEAGKAVDAGFDAWWSKHYNMANLARGAAEDAWNAALTASEAEATSLRAELAKLKGIDRD